MKKLIYTFLAVSIIFAACKKNNDDDDVSIVGTWNATSITASGGWTVTDMHDSITFDTTFTIVETDSIEPSSVQFLSDGTLIAHFIDEPSDTGTYHKSETQLTFTDSDTTMTFTIDLLTADNLTLSSSTATTSTDTINGFTIHENLDAKLEFDRE